MSAMRLCTDCTQGVVRDMGDGWGACPVCGREHDIATLPPLHTNREGAALLFQRKRQSR